MLRHLVLAFIIAGSLVEGFPGEGPCAGHAYGALIPDPTDCSFFYQCQTANTTRMPCPKDLHFSATLKVCVSPLLANCTLGGGTGSTVPTITVPTLATISSLPTVPTPPSTAVPSTPPTSTTTQQPSIEAPCSSLDPETIGDPEDCTRYTYCYMGKPAIVKCAIGEFYSKADNACIETEKCPDNGESGNSSPSTETTSTSTTTISSTTPQGPVIIPPCSSIHYETIGFPDDCSKYIYCENGKPYVVKCAIGEYYSASDNACIVASKCPDNGGQTVVTPSSTTEGISSTPSKPTIVPPCDSLEDDTKEDPTDCTRYYYCSNGAPILIHCYPGQYYSKEKNGCVVASECPAGSGGTTAASTTTMKPTQPPIHLPCTSLETETIEYPGDCTRYYYCEDGYPYVTKCALGQYYSKDAKACIEADECPASIKPTTTTSSSTTTASTTTASTTTASTTTQSITTSTTATQPTTAPTTTPTTTTYTTTTSTTTLASTTPSPIKPPCTSMDTQTWPFPNDCTKYIYCSMGEPYPTQCQKGAYYSAANKSCIAADKCPQTF